MNKLRVIDLLNKIANGEKVPKKIRISFYDEGTLEIYNFTYNKNIRQYEDDEGFTLSSALNITLILNEEIEIIEEDKKIEKIDINHLQTVKKCNRAKILGNKINEIIDYLEEKE